MYKVEPGVWPLDIKKLWCTDGNFSNEIIKDKACNTLRDFNAMVVNCNAVFDHHEK